MDGFWEKQIDAQQQREGMMEMTRQELSKYDGKEGRPAYVAVNNVIYDVTPFSAWAGGIHQDIKAGTDATAAFNECHNHSILERMKIVGRLTDNAPAAEKVNDPPKMKMVWLELNGCSGNIISLLDGAEPDYKYMITEMVDLVYEHSLISSEGEQALAQLFSVLDQDFIFCAEGAIPAKNDGKYLIIGNWKGKDITALELARLLGEKAKYVISVGACSTHGGVTAGSPNPSESTGLQDVLNRKVIRLPGCPCHPEWFLGTMAHLIYFGEPELDEQGRPVFLYGIPIHQRCERRSYFDAGIFATKLGEQTCMFRMGCRGPITQIDCPIRKWNERVNWPVQANTPCIGCAQFGFPDHMEPFVNYALRPVPVPGSAPGGPSPGTPGATPPPTPGTQGGNANE